MSYHLFNHQDFLSNNTLTILRHVVHSREQGWFLELDQNEPQLRLEN